MLKHMIKWTKKDIKELEWYSKRLYAIIRVITTNEYRRVQSYTTFKQEWDILETTYEGTSIIKRSRILKLNIYIELCIIR